MWCLRCLVLGWCKKREFFGVATVKLVLRWLVAAFDKPLELDQYYHSTGVQTGAQITTENVTSEHLTYI